jgi:hypothetical protein
VSTNYGTSTTLRADASQLVRSYLRFNVQGLSGSITRVTPRIFTNSGSSAGYEVRNVADNTWTDDHEWNRVQPRQPRDGTVVFPEYLECRTLISDGMQNR